jgi:hypothetical protein
MINPAGDISNYEQSDLPISVIEQRLNEKQGGHEQQ